MAAHVAALWELQRHLQSWDDWLRQLPRDVERDYWPVVRSPHWDAVHLYDALDGPLSRVMKLPEEPVRGWMDPGA